MKSSDKQGVDGDDGDGDARLKKYGEHVVETGMRFDASRKISVGTARDNDIVRQMTVEEAIRFVRSAESKRAVDDALKWSARLQMELLTLVKEFRTKGRFDFDNTVGLQNLWRNQRKDVAQELTNVLKEFGDQDEEAIKPKLKAIAWRCAKAMRLSGFMWAGRFGLRNNHSLLTPSGLMCVDLDKLKVDIEKLMNNLMNDPLIFWAARSPSGKGVKVLVRVPDDAALNEKTYLACFETFERYMAANYPGVSISVDKQAKAVAQLCFFMHDPDSFWNPDAYILHPDEDLMARRAESAKANKKKPADASGSATDAQTDTKQGSAGKEPQSARREGRGFPFDSYPPDKQWETVRSAVGSLEDWLAGLPPGQGGRNGAWTRLGFAFGEWFKQLADDDIREQAKGWLLELAAQHYAGNEGCVERAMDGSNGTCGLGTLFMMAKEHGGWKPPWASGSRSEGPKKEWFIMEHVCDFQGLLPPIKCVGNQWYKEGNGLWIPVERNEYEPDALEVLPFSLRTSKRATEVMATFQKQQQVPRSTLKTACIWENQTQQAVLVNCRNGLLRVTAEGIELFDHDPEAYCFTGQLAAAYNAGAECQVFERVLSDAQPGNRARHLLIWFIGYMLLPSLKYRICLINYGPTGTSKSTVFDYGVGSVLGDGVTKHLSLSDICSTTGYSLPGLQHALLNVGGELDADELAQSSRFKLLVGGESFEVRGIYGRPFTLRDYIVKLVFLTNHLPRFKSGTDAELARMRFLQWTQVPNVPDPTLQQSLPTEKDGIFSRWMVPALQWVMEGELPPEDDEMVRREFAVRNDPVGVFVKKCCVVEGNASITKDDLFRSFKKFVEVNDLNLGLLEKNTFGRLLLERCCGKVRATRPRGAGGHRSHIYVGIRLTDEFKKECDERGAGDDY